MVPDLKSIYNLTKDILDFRERLLNDISELPDIDFGLAEDVAKARAALFNLYKDLDKILVENGL